MTSPSKKKNLDERTIQSILNANLSHDDLVDVEKTINFSDNPQFFKKEIATANFEDVYSIVSNAPKEVLSNRELMLLCCQKYAYCLKLIPDEFRNDPDFLTPVLNNRVTRNDSSYPMDIISTYCNNELAFNGEVFFGKAVKINGFDFPYIPEAMKQNRHVVMEGAQSNAYECVWHNMDSILKTDNDVLMTFYKRNPLFLYKEIFNKESVLSSFYEHAKKQDESVFVAAITTINKDKWDGDKKNEWYPTAVFSVIVDFTIEQVSKENLEVLQKTIVNDYLRSRIDDRLNVFKTIGLRKKSADKGTAKKARKTGLVK